jgi:hypothetical protein
MAWGTVKAVAKGRGVMEGVGRAQAGIQQSRLNVRPLYGQAIEAMEARAPNPFLFDNDGAYY